DRAARDAVEARRDVGAVGDRVRAGAALEVGTAARPADVRRRDPGGVTLAGDLARHLGERGGDLALRVAGIDRAARRVLAVARLDVCLVALLGDLGDRLHVLREFLVDRLPALELRVRRGVRDWRERRQGNEGSGADDGASGGGSHERSSLKVWAA